MAWTYTYDTTTPANTDLASGGDDRIREIKLAVAERMNVDHDWDVVSDEVGNDQACTHRQVTFAAPISTPGNAANIGIVYTKDVSDKAELHWEDEDGNEVQITTAGQLNITKDSFQTGSVDDDTIEIDASNGLQIKVPSAGSDDDSLYSPIMSHGSYTGNGATGQTISTGLGTIYFLFIFDKATATSPVAVLNCTDGYMARRTQDGAEPTNSTPTISSGDFTLGNDNEVNTDTKTYYYVAFGSR